MTATVLRWRIPGGKVSAWRGPVGMLPAVQRNPSAPIASVIGPQGPAGSGTVRFDVTSPAGTWIIPHGLGRAPAVQLFDDAGNAIISDVTVDSVHITATFGQPQAGFLLAS